MTRSTTGARARDHHITLPVGDPAVGQFKQNVERALRRIVSTELAHAAASRKRALEPAPEIETPAGELAHVLLRQTGERGDHAQGRVDAVEHDGFEGPGGNGALMVATSRVSARHASGRSDRE